MDEYSQKINSLQSELEKWRVSDVCVVSVVKW